MELQDLQGETCSIFKIKQMWNTPPACLLRFASVVNNSHIVVVLPWEISGVIVFLQNSAPTTPIWHPTKPKKWKASSVPSAKPCSRWIKRPKRGITWPCWWKERYTKTCGFETFWGLFISTHSHHGIVSQKNIDHWSHLRLLRTGSRTAPDKLRSGPLPGCGLAEQKSLTPRIWRKFWQVREGPGLSTGGFLGFLAYRVSSKFSGVF